MVIGWEGSRLLATATVSWPKGMGMGGIGAFGMKDSIQLVLYAICVTVCVGLFPTSQCVFPTLTAMFFGENFAMEVVVARKGR